MRSLMNLQVDPCDDFYEFSCGNYGTKGDEIVKHAEDDRNSMIQLFKDFEPIFKTEKIAWQFFGKCMNTENETLDTSFWQDEKNDLTDILIEMSKVDTVNTGLLKNGVYPQSKPDPLVLVLQNGLDQHPILKNLSQQVLKEDPTLDVIEQVHNFMIGENEFEFLNMTKYIAGLLPRKYRKNADRWDFYVNKNELKLIDRVVKKLGVKKIKEILFEKWTDKLMLFLVETPVDRHESCFRRTEMLFPGTLAKIFVRKFVSAKNVEKSNELFKNIRAAFAEMLTENTWIDAELKRVLLAELAALESSIGVADIHKDLRRIEKIYERVEETQTIEQQTYLTLVRNLLKMNSEETFLRVSQLDELRFLDSPITYNANYFAYTHIISLAPFFLNYPYIDENLPAWSTVSSLGYILAHELGHAFDAKLFFKSTKYEEYDMNAETRAEFEKRIKCLTDKYDKFEYADGTRADGEFTKQEDSADLIGFNLSWRIFEKMLKSRKNQKLPGFEKFSLKQQFFQRMAYTWCGEPLITKWQIDADKEDDHSASKFRVNGMMLNSKHFADAFQCEKKSQMNPVEKCPLFK